MGVVVHPQKNKKKFFGGYWAMNLVIKDYCRFD